jgi:hypothetical protein
MIKFGIDRRLMAFFCEEIMTTPKWQSSHRSKLVCHQVLIPSTIILVTVNLCQEDYQIDLVGQADVIRFIPSFRGSTWIGRER